MTYTPVQPAAVDFTHAAHVAAREQFYPGWFPGLPLAFTDHFGTDLDKKQAIDITVAVKLARWKPPVSLYVQERFRIPKYVHAGDISITRWNQRSNTPAELHHFWSGVFVYGFFDQRSGQILKATAYSAPLIFTLLARGKLTVRDLPPNNRDQDAILLREDELWIQGCVLHQMKSRALDGTYPGQEAFIDET